MELVDTLDLGSSAARRESSSLSFRTINYSLNPYFVSLQLFIIKEFKHRQRTISYTLWENSYKPIKESEDSWAKGFSSFPKNTDIFDRIIKENTIWTEFAEGDSWWIEPRIGFCDRVAIYIKNI